MLVPPKIIRNSVLPLATMVLTVSLDDLAEHLGEVLVQTLPIVLETLAEMVDRPTQGGMEQGNSNLQQDNNNLQQEEDLAESSILVLLVHCASSIYRWEGRYPGSCHWHCLGFL